MVAILEGTVEATGMQMQAKTSYLGDEILWGHEFVNTIVDDQWWGGRYRVDFSLFDDTFAVHTPRMSAKEYYEGKGHCLAHSFSVDSAPEDFEQNFDGGNVTEEEEEDLEDEFSNGHCAVDINLTDDDSPGAVYCVWGVQGECTKCWKTFILVNRFNTCRRNRNRFPEARSYLHWQETIWFI